MPGLITVFLVMVVGMSEATAAIVGPILFSIGASLVLGAVGKLFTKGPSASSLTNQVASRTITSRPAVET
jgi:predicted phage tail protein